MIFTGWSALLWLSTAKLSGAFLLEHRRAEEPMMGSVLTHQVNEKNQFLIIEWEERHGIVRRSNFNCFIWDVTVISLQSTSTQFVSLSLRGMAPPQLVDAPYPGSSLYTIVIPS